MEKHAFWDVLSFSKKEKEFYKEICGTVKKNKECKKCYHKKIQLRKFFKYV